MRFLVSGCLLVGIVVVLVCGDDPDGGPANGRGMSGPDGGGDGLAVDKPTPVPVEPTADVSGVEVIGGEGPGFIGPMLPTLGTEVMLPVAEPTAEVVVDKPVGGVPVDVKLPAVKDAVLAGVEEILGRSAEAMDRYGSGSYRLVARTGVDLGELGKGVEGLGDVDVEMTIEADYLLPDRQRATLGLGGSFFQMTVDMVIIGEDVYVKDPFTEVWMADNSGDDLGGGFQEMTQLVQDRGVAEALVFLGQAELDGVSVYHLSGEIGPNLMEVLLDVPVEAGSMAKMDFWIGVEDLLVRGFDMSFTSQGVESEVEARFFDCGKEVEIEAPEVGQSLTTLPGEKWPSYGCDEALQELLVNWFGVIDAAEVNRLVAELQASSEDCGEFFWNPLAADGAGDVVAGPMAPVWAYDMTATGVSRCFGGVAPSDAPAVAGMAVGGQVVPPGLREGGLAGALVQSETGRSPAGDLLVYWAGSFDRRPAGVSACWLYVAGTGQWTGNQSLGSFP